MKKEFFYLLLIVFSANPALQSGAGARLAFKLALKQVQKESSSKPDFQFTYYNKKIGEGVQRAALGLLRLNFQQKVPLLSVLKN